MDRIKMTIDDLATEQGKLAEILPLFDPNSIQHSDEITTARRDKKGLRNMWFGTADGSLYTVKDGEAYLSLTRREHNPVFKNVEEATKQLSQDQNYNVPQEQVAAALEAESTLTVKISDLELQIFDDEFGYFEVDTKNYNDTLNPAQRLVAERVYDQKEDFIENMRILKEEEGINKVRVYVLNPEYVLDNVKEGQAVSRACWLSDFGYDSYFFAYLRFVDGNRLGVLLDVAEGDAPKISEEKPETICLEKKKAYDLLEKYVPEERLDEARTELAELCQ